MFQADFFDRFGFLSVRDFFTTDVCEQLCADMRSGAGNPATVVGRGTPHVDEHARRTLMVDLDPSTLAWVHRQLQTLVPGLEAHFGLVFQGCEKPQFLRYREGDFFQRHRDGGYEPTDPEYLKARKVSTVIFLNEPIDASSQGAYEGGALTFYKLMASPRLEGRGFPLIGERGMLVAFRSDTLHAVSAVTRGERFSIVSWFF